jgi:hypothetical protein
MEKVNFALRKFLELTLDLLDTLFWIMIWGSVLASLLYLSYLWVGEILASVPALTIDADGSPTNFWQGLGAIILTLICCFLIIEYGVVFNTKKPMRNLPRLLITMLGFASALGTPSVLGGLWWSFPLGLVLALTIPPFIWDKLQKRYGLP